jgi:hypothetical protein
MRKQRNRGFLLTFAIVALALMGAIFFVLAGGAGKMLFHADMAYLQATERNLVASGLAWARANISANGDAGSENVALDTDAFGAQNPGLAVRIMQVQPDHATVRIASSCSKGRRTLTTCRDYTLDLR